jgi:hypothetical protein
MAIERRAVFSSHIANIGYDPESRTLAVGYKSGGETEYADVAPETASQVMSSASIGQAIHQYVRGKHGHTSRQPGKPEVTKPAPELGKEIGTPR